MTTLTLELSPDLYDRLRDEAARLDKPAEVVVREWLAPPAPAAPGERERAIEEGIS